MDADRVILACATRAELRAARRSGSRTALVGLAAANGVPDGSVISFGLAGSLRDDFAPGTLLDATRVVDTAGTVLWEGEPLGVAGAERVTILAAETIVDDPTERRRLHASTGADAADLESGPLARSGRLSGVLRAVSDTPERTLYGMAEAVTPAGDYDWAGLARAFAREPRGFARAAADARRALGRLADATRSLG